MSTQDVNAAFTTEVQKCMCVAFSFQEMHTAVTHPRPTTKTGAILTAIQHPLRLQPERGNMNCVSRAATLVAGTSTGCNPILINSSSKTDATNKWESTT